MSTSLEIIPIEGLPEIAAGDRLGHLVAAALERQGVELADGDAVCVSQKVVSKAEGRTRRLSEVEAGKRAAALAGELDKDPRLVELILAESTRIVRAARGVLITETHQGWTCANAGIDSSNVPDEDAVTLLPLDADEDAVTLLPLDADESARRIRAELGEVAGARPAVIVADSFGRPWRIGQTEVAIGCAGLAPVDDWRGRHDADGMELAATAIAVADELACAADLARDKASGEPAVLVRGAGRHRTDADGPGAGVLRRPAGDDLFR